MTVYEAPKTRNPSMVAGIGGTKATSKSPAGSSERPLPIHGQDKLSSPTRSTMLREAATGARDVLDQLAPRSSRSWVARHAARQARRSLKEVEEQHPQAGLKRRLTTFASVRTYGSTHTIRRYLGHLMVLVLTLSVALGGRVKLDAQPAAGGRPQVAEQEEAKLELEQRPVSLLTTNRSSQGTSSQEALSLSASLRQPATGPSFSKLHVVGPDDTLGKLAESYQVTPLSIAAANNLLEGGVLAIGDQLRIPSQSGVPYVLQEGDRLEEVAERHGVSLASIIAYGPNDLIAGDTLPVGREIFIPGGVLQGLGEESLAELSAIPTGVVLEDEANCRNGPTTRHVKEHKLNSGTQVEILARNGEPGDMWYKVRQPSGETCWMSTVVLSVGEQISSLVAESDNFPAPPPIWVTPTWGDLTSYFGYRYYPYRSFHDGIDIANDKWTPISAARDGTVIEAGWCSGFGWCVKMRHDSGFSTIYGHMAASPEVRTGDWVEAGELIGYMGSSYDRAGGGYSTGVHLHFTVKVDGVAVNPLNYIPW